MFRRVKIWSLQDRPQQIPACSSRSVLSTASLRRRRRTMQNTFSGTEKVVVPVVVQLLFQLLQSARFIFFGSLMMTPLCQFSGTWAVAQHLFRRVVSCSTMEGPPCFNISADIMSNPGTLLFFSRWIDAVVSVVVMWFTAKSLSGAGELKAKSFGGICWLSISLKCSTHLLSWFSAVRSTFPFLSLMGTPCPLLALVRSHMIW